MDINGGQKQHCNCLSFTVTFFLGFLLKCESWGVTALEPVAPAREEVATESEAPLFISPVSRPLNIFFLLINLLTPLYYVNWEWETLQMGIAANNW